MSCALLGEPFDIHGGGMDLQFPAPRERDRAERRRQRRRRSCNYWMHNGFLNIDDEKMSKSLGNFFTIADVLQRFDGETVRFFMLRTHYRSPFNFSDQLLDETRTALQAAVHRAATAGDGARRRPPRSTGREPRAAAFKAAMDDDFNTPRRLAVLFELAGEVNRGRSAPTPRCCARWAACWACCSSRRSAYLQGGDGLDEARDRGAHRSPRRGQAGARLRRWPTASAPNSPRRASS